MRHADCDRKKGDKKFRYLMFLYDSGFINYEMIDVRSRFRMIQFVGNLAHVLWVWLIYVLYQLFFWGAAGGSLAFRCRVILIRVVTNPTLKCSEHGHIYFSLTEAPFAHFFFQLTDLLCVGHEVISAGSSTWWILVAIPATGKMTASGTC